MTDSMPNPTLGVNLTSRQQLSKPERLLEIFRQLQAGEIDEDQATEALEIRRQRRYGRVGRFVEAITS